MARARYLVFSQLICGGLGLQVLARSLPLGVVCMVMEMLEPDLDAIRACFPGFAPFPLRRTTVP